MDGVVSAPSEFVITFGSPPSIMATHELVVPRSIPMTLPISSFLAWLMCCHVRLNLVLRHLLFGGPLLALRPLPPDGKKRHARQPTRFEVSLSPHPWVRCPRHLRPRPLSSIRSPWPAERPGRAGHSRPEIPAGRDSREPDPSPPHSPPHAGSDRRAPLASSRASIRTVRRYRPFAWPPSRFHPPTPWPPRCPASGCAPVRAPGYPSPASSPSAGAAVHT